MQERGFLPGVLLPVLEDSAEELRKTRSPIVEEADSHTNWPGASGAEGDKAIERAARARRWELHLEETQQNAGAAPAPAGLLSPWIARREQRIQDALAARRLLLDTAVELESMHVDRSRAPSPELYPCSLAPRAPLFPRRSARKM
jgi:hypothetical protein